MRNVAENRAARAGSGNPNHGWLIASYCVVGVIAVIALGVLEPALDVPVVIAFTVARYSSPPHSAS